MNGNMNGDLPQPTPTPVPTVSAPTNGDVNTGKSVRWNGSEREMMEIQRAGAAIGVNGRSASGYADYNSMSNDSNNVKFISLASPLSSVDGAIMSTYKGPLHVQQRELSKSTVLNGLPMKATLHVQKQIPGRYFPSPSYTEFQRDVLESRPTPRRVIRKFKPNHSNGNSLFPAGSPVKARTAAEKSAWIANQLYSRNSQTFMVEGDGWQPSLDQDYQANNMTQVRQYSIPATTKFHDGNNDTLITGSSIPLRNKSQESSLDLVPHNGTT